MLETNKDTVKQLQNVLVGFEEPGDTIGNLKEKMEASRDKSERELDFPPELIELLFSSTLKFPRCEGTEKTVWTIFFLYRDIDCSFELKNIGLRLFLRSDQADKKSLATAAEEIVTKTTSALLLLEQESLIPGGLKLIKKGKFTMENQYVNMYAMYRYFRTQAQKIYAKINKKSREAKNISALFKETALMSQHGFYNSLAMMDAYFSSLEHLLVLVLPFTDPGPKPSQLFKILAMNWEEKFQLLFDIQQNATAGKHFDRLRTLRKKFHSFYAHGDIEKKDAHIYFHATEIGKTPVQLIGTALETDLDFLRLEKVAFEDACRLFDDVDQWLLTEKTRFGVMFAQRGFRVSFDNKSRNLYLKAMESEESFKKMLKAQLSGS